MPNKSQSIRARLSHPIIDSDGHWREFEPIAMDFLKEEGGQELVDAWKKRVRIFGELAYGKMTREEKLAKRAGQPPWWSLPVQPTIDVATSFVPRLLHQRLPEMGIDFAVLYPTTSQLFAPFLGDNDLRVAGTRALNTYVATVWKPYADRCTPVGMIPMATPAEAVAELDHCKALGFKAVALGSLIRRDIPELKAKGISRRHAHTMDVLGIDSLYDYDPVWAKCQEHGFAATFHTATVNTGLRNSVSNYAYNHIGHFAEAGSAVAKALFIGGVTRRFPKLKFAFMEGGCAWACSLYSDIIGHWEKRNASVIQNLNPDRLDHAGLAKLLQEHGGDAYASRHEELKAALMNSQRFHPDELDDFAAAKIRSKADIRDLFVPRFFFGCEADDPTTNYAFAAKVNPLHAKLGAVLASDISHWDVPDMTEVLEEAYELVEEQGMSEEDFRAFTFVNPVELWAGGNPDFFKGTVVEGRVSQYLHKVPG